MGEAMNEQPWAWKQGQGKKLETLRIYTLYKGIVKFMLKLTRFYYNSALSSQHCKQ